MKFVTWKWIFGILVAFLVSINFPEIDCAASDSKIKYSTVSGWASKFGTELWNLGEYATRRKEVQDSFKQAQIVPRNGEKIVQDMAKEIKYMLDARISAIKRIVDTAQEVAAISEDEVEKNFTYFNAKEMIEPSEIPPTDTPDYSDEEFHVKQEPKPIIHLTESSKFVDFVNFTVSSVHVPANVYDRANEVIKAIKWSEVLDNIFVSNYNRDPSLFWQFFCSTEGFLRQYPAAKWKADPVDLYDCRKTLWYIMAANSPKDVVILIDNSGSMTGQRKDIARHVVENILDTLTPNDFVNIYTFSDSIRELVECFADILVPGTSSNIRELKQALLSIETAEIANFTAALTKAFELLQTYRIDRLGANCNQAIMLVSDGVPLPYTDVFEAYNWQDKSNMPVRIFTYLVGREVADVKEIKAMACDNQGYYVHLSTLAEVREQVLNYIPVVARPLVLNRTHHPIVYSQVYADVVDPQMTDYEWECRERFQQKERFLAYRRNRNPFNLPDDPSSLSYDFIEDDHNEKSKKYQFVTTVSIPVYDKRENATKIAHLLGVAGTDIKIEDIKNLMQPFLLGVGGYAFIVDNNGMILMHPDFRPIFYKDILKPAYNSVDMVEVELMDDDHEPREFNPLLLNIREAIINQTTGSKWMLMKYHFDKMRRASRLKRNYYYTEIKETPFTLVVTYPEQYGMFRLQTRNEDEIHRYNVKGTNVLGFFNGTNWKIHPDWLYCKHSNETFSAPEVELLYFLERMKNPGWRWPLNRPPIIPEYVFSTNTSNQKFSFDKDSYYCDRNLMQSLVYDAKITEWFSKNTSFGPNEKGNEFKQRFGVSVSFLATHSGLLRWIDYTQGDDFRPENDFSENNKRAIDEIWYKRAVEQHFVEPMSFVYSVPFDSSNRNDTLVTATHAIFHKENGKSAPVAVVGFQFQHSAMVTHFRNITNNCVDSKCEQTCAHDELECFVLDDNGYVIAGPDLADTGKFFGEVRSIFMQKLVDEKVFKKITIYDYQAVCFISKDQGNPANTLLTPFRYIWELFKLIKARVVWLFLSALVDQSSAYANYAYGSENFLYSDADYGPDPTERYDFNERARSKEQDFDRRVLINRTRPERCDKIITLYQLNNKDKTKSAYDRNMNGCERPFMVMPIPSSNMILLVADTLCPNEPSPYMFQTQPIEKDYNASTLTCYKSKITLYRRTTKYCFNRHPNETGIELCGRGSRLSLSFHLFCLVFLVVFKIYRLVF